MQQELKLLIAVPTAGMVPIGFTYSLTSLVSYHSTFGIPSRKESRVSMAIEVRQSSCIQSNREKLAKSAIEQGMTHLLFIDDDMTFEPKAVEIMLGRRQPVVVTNYLIKSALDPQFLAIGLEGQRVPTREDSTGMLPILYSGFGLSLFEVEVFKKTPQPWFQPEYDPEESAYTTEDFSFFERVRNSGFDVFLDQDASKLIGHIGKKIWRWDEWKPQLHVAGDDDAKQKVA